MFFRCHCRASVIVLLEQTRPSREGCRLSYVNGAIMFLEAWDGLFSANFLFMIGLRV